MSDSVKGTASGLGGWLRYGLIGAAGVAGGLAAFSTISARRAERRVPPDGRFIDVDGARLHYADIGTGPPILMIHGLAGQLRNFTYALTDRLVGHHRVIAIDRPGSGYSRFVGAGGRGLHAQAAIVGRLIAALELDRPLLVGHSLGGAVALALATDRPDLVGGLALIAPLTQVPTDTPAVFGPLDMPSPIVRALVAHTLAVPLGRLARGRTLQAIFAPDPVPDDFGERGGGLLSSRPGAIHSASSEVSGGAGDLEDVILAYRDIRLPVGILYGRGDRVLSPEWQGEATAAAIPGAQLHLIDGGHMIPLTRPDETAEWLLAQAKRVIPAAEG